MNRKKYHRGGFRYSMGNVLTGLVAGTVITASALTNVEVAENTLKALLQEKQEFIEKTEQVTKEVRTIVDRYDLDKKERYVADLDLWIKIQQSKQEEIKEYKGYYEDIEGSIEKIEASRNDLQEQIRQKTEQGTEVSSKLFDNATAITAILQNDSKADQAIQLLKKYETGTEGFGYFLDHNFKMQKAYNKYSVEQLKTIFDAYRDYDSEVEKKPLSWMGILYPESAVVNGQSMSVKGIDEKGFVLFGYREAEEDVKELDKQFDLFLSEIEHLKGIIKENTELTALLQERSTLKEEYKAIVKEIEPLNVEKSRLDQVLLNLNRPAYLDGLKSNSASAEEIKQAEQIYNILKDANKNILLSEDMPVIEGESEWVNKYNEIINEGKSIYENYRSHFDLIRNAPEHIAKLNDQISRAERVLGEEKAKELQAEEKAEQAEESKEDKVEIKTTDYGKKEDKNKKTITIPTGVEGVNLIVPITITMATLGGITGYSIYSKRRRKARK